MENANHMTRITLLLSAQAITTLASCAKKPEFSELTPEDTSIVVQMPRPIEHKVKEAQLGDEDVTAHAHMASIDWVSLVLNHPDIQIAATFPLEPSYNQELYARRFVESARLR